MEEQQQSEVLETLARYYPSNALSLTQLAHWIAFSRVMGIGPVRFKLLLTYFQDDAEAAWHATAKDLAEAGLDQKVIESFQKQCAAIDPLYELERLKNLRIEVITWKDEGYPALLRKIEYAPPVLYICGKLTDDDRHYTIGIVGTRKMSTYGRQVTEHLTRELVKGKITVVSGLAMGVDTVAHTTALDAGGRTIAVLACGLDTIYPPANHGLARRIVESGQGALLTAFPLGIKPDAGNFPARNHIISGLSLGILVTEAPQKSGSILTANSALAQGREVYAVPSNIFSPSGSGSNKLIRDGAHPVTSISDILEHLNIHIFPAENEIHTRAPQNEEEKILLAVLTREPQHIDDLIRQAELPAHIVTSTLTILELDDMVKQVGNMQYIRTTTA